MVPPSLQQLHKILTDAGYRCSVKPTMVVVDIAASGTGRVLGMKPTPDALQTAYVWPHRIEASRCVYLGSLVDTLNARIPTGAWTWNPATGSLAYKANQRWPRSDAHLGALVIRATRFQTRLLGECKRKLDQALCQGGGSLGTNDTLTWCQPQLETLPTEEQVSSEEWQSVVRAVLGPAAEATGNTLRGDGDLPF